MVTILNDYLVLMKQIVIRFGLLAACLLLLLQLGQFTVSSKRFSEELIFACFAILFLTFGYVVSKYFQNKPTSNAVEQQKLEISTSINQAKIDELNISKREYEVLELIHLGHSNLEISQKLYISESTVKSHVSSLLSKLNAKRRTQAVNTAKELQII